MNAANPPKFPRRKNSIHTQRKPPTMQKIKSRNKFWLSRVDRDPIRRIHLLTNNREGKVRYPPAELKKRKNEGAMGNISNLELQNVVIVRSSTLRGYHSLPILL